MFELGRRPWAGMKCLLTRSVEREVGDTVGGILRVVNVRVVKVVGGDLIKYRIAHIVKQ